MYNANPYNFNPYLQPMMSNNGQQFGSQVNNQVNATQNRQGLNGKLVDSIDVVKATEVNLDGSISYFPLTDGTAIVTKQLLTNGTSKTTVYKPVEEKDTPKVEYATKEDLEKSIKKIDLSDIDDLKDEIKEIKSEIKKMRKGD